MKRLAEEGFGAEGLIDLNMLDVFGAVVVGDGAAEALVVMGKPAVDGDAGAGSGLLGEFGDLGETGSALG